MVQIDFPRNLVEFQSRFSDEDACREQLFRMKWPDGYHCRKCGGTEYYLIASRDVYECPKCHVQQSLTEGTVMHKTRKPLSLWFLAIYLMATSKQGISAAELARKLGFGSKTAWTWLTKIRLALGRREQRRLLGEVEVDEAYVGGHNKGGKRGRGSESKTPIAAAVEINGGRIGRLRLTVIEGVDELTLHRFIKQEIETGATLKTDGYGGYNLMNSQGYAVAKFVAGTASSEDPTSEVHKAISNLKRWLLGTHQGRVSRQHLQKYLDEFVYRFNRRFVKYEGRLAELMLGELVGGRPETYWEIIGRSNPATVASHAA